VVVVKSSVFWDVMPCRALLATCFHAGFFLGLFFDPEDGWYVPPKRQFAFNGLHGIISQKIELFIFDSSYNLI
jgi:hypothetical protein